MFESFRAKRMVQVVRAPGVLLFFAFAAFAQLQTPNVQAGEHVGAVAIVVTRFGPNPTSITQPKGPFLLFIVNHSGVLDDTFSLVREAPQSDAAADTTSAAGVAKSKPVSLLDLHSNHWKQRDHKLLDPLPGSYQLLFLSHPNWVVNLTITAN